MRYAVTDPEILTTGVAEGSADPELDPTEIDWPTRQSNAWIPFQVINGRPVSPADYRLGLRGRAGFGRWGENRACDAIVFASKEGVRHLLMIERDDDTGWALPGGFLEQDESPREAVTRELYEETLLSVPDSVWTPLTPRVMPDLRGTDESWVVSVPFSASVYFSTYVHRNSEMLPPVHGSDDARKAMWVPSETYAGLCYHMARQSYRLFHAHMPLLAEVLGT